VLGRRRTTKSSRRWWSSVLSGRRTTKSVGSCWRCTVLTCGIVPTAKSIGGARWWPILTGRLWICESHASFLTWWQVWSIHWGLSSHVSYHHRGENKENLLQGRSNKY
jgi:hypothetical protein